LTAVTLQYKIVEEAENDLPFDKRPSWIWLNGKRIARESYKRHKLLFPRSRLRMKSRVAWAAAVVAFGLAITLISRTFHI
jgi:hypothetical protein